MKRLNFGLVLMMIITLTACEEQVVPPDRSDAAFTMYGYIDPTKEVQALRVFPVEFLLDETQPDPIDAVVTSVDLTTGETQAWSDSLKKFIAGPYAHFFYSEFTPRHEHRYRIMIDRSDGAHVEVTTTIPPLTAPVVTEPDVDNFDLIAPVFWPNAPNLIDIRVIYYSNVIRMEWDYEVNQEELADGRQVLVNFRRDTRDIFTQAIILGVSDVILTGVEIRAVVTDEDWVPPDGRFDPNVLVEPGTFSNVDGGFGFVGSGYQTSVTWIPSDEVLDEAGFYTN